eukprot:3487077-Rhodomonas_salina.1
MRQSWFAPDDSVRVDLTADELELARDVGDVHIVEAAARSEQLFDGIQDGSEASGTAWALEVFTTGLDDLYSEVLQRGTRDAWFLHTTCQALRYRANLRASPLEIRAKAALALARATFLLNTPAAGCRDALVTWRHDAQGGTALSPAECEPFFHDPWGEQLDYTRPASAEMHEALFAAEFRWFSGTCVA